MASRSSRHTRTAIALCAGLLTLTAVPASAQGSRIFISVSAGQQEKVREFNQAGSLKINQETAPISAIYGVGSGTLFDAGGSARIWKMIWAGAAYSQFSKGGSADVTASIPHPFFFNQNRNIQGSTTDAEHAEKDIHIAVQVPLALTHWLEARAFAGPSFMSVEQKLVTTVNYSETYPYDTAAFAAAPTERVSKSAVGYNAGIDATVYFSRTVGAGVLVRYSRATLNLTSKLGNDVSIKAGGVQFGGGVRLRF